MLRCRKKIARIPSAPGSGIFRRRRTQLALLVCAAGLLAGEARLHFFRDYLGAAESHPAAEDAEALEDLFFASAFGEGAEDDELCRSRAEVYFANQNYERAAAELMRADLRDPANRELRGRIAAATGDRAEAEGHFAQAFASRPSAELLLRRAENLVRSGEGAAALNLFASAPAFGAEAEVSYYRGLVEFDQQGTLPAAWQQSGAGGHQEEIRLLQECAARLQAAALADEAYRAVLKADCFNRIQEPAFAAKPLDELLSRAPQYRDAWLTRGKTFLIESAYAEAAAAFEAGLKLDADNSELLFWLGETYAKLGEGEKAAASRERFSQLAPEP